MQGIGFNSYFWYLLSLIEKTIVLFTLITTVMYSLLQLSAIKVTTPCG